MRPLSPGGALLRASRLFSLPKPLRPPVSEARSPTATTGHPTHQAITTTEASRRGGDWGIKYPLPAKSTARTSTPCVRVLAVDAPESVTDFRSAADHALALEKLTEMNISMRLPYPRSGHASYRYWDPTGPRSVFNRDQDRTTFGSEEDRRDAVDRRWRFSGPYLAGLSDGRFEQFMDRHVRSPRGRHRFRNFLRRHAAAKINEDNAERTGGPRRDRIGPGEVTDQQMLEYTRELRSDLSALHQVVGDFLDLAPMRRPPIISTGSGSGSSSSAAAAAMGTELVNAKWSDSPHAELGPPATHPSAGISYLRTSAFLDNHPLHGPQLHRAAVQGRVLMPRQPGGGAKIGLGGFVVEPGTGMYGTAKGNRIQGVYNFDQVVQGGAKAWMTAESAVVKPTGHVLVSAAKAPYANELVQRELRGEDVREIRERVAGQALTRPIAAMAWDRRWRSTRVDGAV